VGRARSTRRAARRVDSPALRGVDLSFMLFVLVWSLLVVGLAVGLSKISLWPVLYFSLISACFNTMLLGDVEIRRQIRRLRTPNSEGPPPTRRSTGPTGAFIALAILVAVPVADTLGFARIALASVASVCLGFLGYYVPRGAQVARREARFGVRYGVSRRRPRVVYVYAPPRTGLAPSTPGARTDEAEPSNGLRADEPYLSE
jgi:hypothetical protein